MPFWKKKPNPQKLQQEAFTAFENGEMEQAFEKLLQLREIHPTPDGLYYLGVMFDMVEQKEESLKALNQAVSMDPSHSQALYSLAMVHNSIGQTPDALKAIEKAYEADPNDFRVLNLCAHLLLETEGDAARAVEIAKKACDMTAWEDEICLDTYKRAVAASGGDDAAVASDVESNQPINLTFELIAHVEQHVRRKANENSLQNIVPYSEVAVAVQTIEAETDEGTGVAFTTGMSHKAVHRKDGLGFEFAELCMYLPGSWRPSPEIDDRIWPWQCLQQLGNRPHMDDERYHHPGYLREPQVVCIADEPEPLGAGVEFTALLLLPDLHSSVPPCQTSTGKTVPFITVMPIYTNEYELAQRDGVGKLIELVGKAGLQPHLVPGRASVVT